uniref:carbonic anhydrase n=1 Tax=Megaselia scalaris TaxID=36166 RepID=T1GCJ5_MEGSC
MMKAFAIISFVISVSAWNYKDQDTWSQEYSQCNGLQQSPIDLLIESTIEKDSIPIEFIRYNKIFKGYDMILENNGRTIQLSFSENIPDEFRPSIIGGILGNETFILDQIHFHWGSGTGRGAEHTFNSKRYELEVHLVHRNSKYDSVEGAAGEHNGLTVLGILGGFREISDCLQFIRYSGNSTSLIYNFNPGKAFPVDKMEGFFNYVGSLTTPECSENVNWIVFNDVQRISEIELEKFRSLKTEDGSDLMDNWRVGQDLNGRNVYFIKNIS